LFIARAVIVVVLAIAVVASPYDSTPVVTQEDAKRLLAKFK
jgi:hypothetical protein